MLNVVVLIGRLTQDPELRYTPGNGVPVSTFTLAVNRSFTNQQGEREADFINIVTWRKLAENCANYLKKGSMAAVTGRLQIRSYDDSQGVRRKVAEVVASDVRFLDKGRSADDGKSDDYGESSAENIDISEDDVPF
ncbi:MAG TPA: single-stranded DNA-binding protein [Firmicutes bacterium]|nr:single-stranded DNA-binding protein [Bacillota bacterium]